MNSSSDEDVSFLESSCFVEKNGTLQVFEFNKENLNIDVKRVFTVNASKGSVRGEHAHIACTQLLYCLSGEIEVHCESKKGIKSIYKLEPMSLGLKIPPGIWSRQIYKCSNSILLVLCDKSYDESDYIRIYSDFKNY